MDEQGKTAPQPSNKEDSPLVASRRGHGFFAVASTCAVLVQDGCQRPAVGHYPRSSNSGESGCILGTQLRRPLPRPEQNSGAGLRSSLLRS
jgi:hypothetical protein